MQANNPSRKLALWARLALLALIGASSPLTAQESAAPADTIPEPGETGPAVDDSTSASEKPSEPAAEPVAIEPAEATPPLEGLPEVPFNLPAPPDPSDPSKPPLATMRIRGSMPEGATEFSWAYGLVIDPYPMSITDGAGEIITHWVEGPFESDRFEIAGLTPPSRWTVVLTYLKLGFTHILPKGLDHILFVIGIFLLSTRMRPIVAQVTTFTVAHTIALGMTIFGVISLRSSGRLRPRSPVCRALSAWLPAARRYSSNPMKRNRRRRCRCGWWPNFSVSTPRPRLFAARTCSHWRAAHPRGAGSHRMIRRCSSCTARRTGSSRSGSRGEWPVF